MTLQAAAVALTVWLAVALMVGSMVGRFLRGDHPACTCTRRPRRPHIPAHVELVGVRNGRPYVLKPVRVSRRVAGRQN